MSARQIGFIGVTRGFRVDRGSEGRLFEEGWHFAPADIVNSMIGN